MDAHGPLPRGAPARPDAGRAGAVRRRGARACRPCWSSRPRASTHAPTPSGEPVLLEDQDRARWDHLLDPARSGRALARRGHGPARRRLHGAGGHRRLPRPRPPRRRHGLDAHRRALRPALVGRRQPRRRGQPGRCPRPRLRSRLPGSRCSTRSPTSPGAVPRPPGTPCAATSSRAPVAPSEAADEFRTAASLTRNDAERSLLLRRARVADQDGLRQAGDDGAVGSIALPPRRSRVARPST